MKTKKPWKRDYSKTLDAITTPSPQRPKARVMWHHAETKYYDEWISDSPERWGKRGRVGIYLPTATRKQALALKKFWDLGEEEQVEAVAKLACANTPTWNNWRTYEIEARAILRLIKG